MKCACSVHTKQLDEGLAYIAGMGRLSSTCCPACPCVLSVILFAHLHAASMEDEGDAALAGQLLVQAPDLGLDQLHEDLALAADTAAAGQHGKRTARDRHVRQREADSNVSIITT